MFDIGNKPIFPISALNQMRTGIHMSPIKYQSAQFTSSKKDSGNIAILFNRKLQTGRHIFLKSIGEQK